MCKHLAKLYDSIAKLKWKMDHEKITKIAIVMVAKDGEEMTIYGNCDCSGKVCSYSLLFLEKVYIVHDVVFYISTGYITSFQCYYLLG